MVEPLPAGWTENLDPNSGKNFYYNATTGETTWDRPCSAPAAAFDYTQITPDYVRALQAPTESFLCPILANNKGLDFTSFRVRTLGEGTSTTLFERASSRPDGVAGPDLASLDDTSRFIRYNFPPEFLDYPTIGTLLEFNIGEEPLHDILMVERHYFRDQLIHSYEFGLPFGIPSTRNTWEMIYTQPQWDDAWKGALRASNYEVKSDSFYFILDPALGRQRLIMHNKAEYSFSGGGF